IYREVSTLDPGCYLTLGPSGTAKRQRYWRPQFQPAPQLSAADWADQMRAMLLETTARHLQADVPVAAFLSGGIDSSAILAAMVRASGDPVKAFTIGHPGSSIDETAAARLIARHLGCEHIVAPLEIESVADVLPVILRSYDEPFADMAAIPTWFVSRLASRDVKVVLCGEGGDELFAGYKRHRNAHLIERHRAKIGAIAPLTRALSRIPVTGSARANLVRQYAQRFTEFTEVPGGYQQFFAATQISRRTVREQLFDPQFAAKFEGRDLLARLEREYFPADSRTSLSALEQFLFADLTVNLPSAMLTRLDRASMAHSVEARVPFLSHRMVEWALTIPTDVKLRGRTGKLILRNAVAPWLPPSILRLPKQGFQVPMATWLRGRFGEFARAVWNDSGASQLGYLDGNVVERTFAEHKRGKADHSRILYAITVFALWWLDHRARRTLKAADAA
ncbi:MAG TPA: asparagine synthase C-terminal domain-containing protein, partial [Sphingomicrobium sp.]|nr:asparagine synthase C-terminal domain-containing protein [Sphingomicrobium sp.]